MQIIKSITAKNIFKKYPDIKKQLWGGHFWSDGGYIGTVGDGVTADIIKRYAETQHTKEETFMTHGDTHEHENYGIFIPKGRLQANETFGF